MFYHLWGIISKHKWDSLITNLVFSPIWSVSRATKKKIISRNGFCFLDQNSSNIRAKSYSSLQIYLKKFQSTINSNFNDISLERYWNMHYSTYDKHSEGYNVKYLLRLACPGKFSKNRYNMCFCLSNLPLFFLY